LRDFFVNTVKKSDLSVIYVFSKGFAQKWNPVLEAGAGWILQSKYFPVFTDTHDSVRKPFSQTLHVPCLVLDMDDRQTGLLASALYMIAQHAGKKDATESAIHDFIKSSKLYKDA